MSDKGKGALTCGSLFAGIGGFDLGFERAGIKTIWQVEIDEYCRRVLQARFPDALQLGDIRQCCGIEHRHSGNCGRGHFLSPIDIICGGDPCQENSNARRAHDTVSPSLGAEFIRIVAELRPRLVVRENPAAIRADAPWPWWRFRSELERLGYVVLPFRFRACCVGADFRRDRLFLLADLQGAQCSRLERHEREVMAGTDYRRYNADSARPDRWSSAPRICGRTDGISNRVDRLRSLGNAVVPQISQWIGERIVECERQRESEK